MNKLLTTLLMIIILASCSIVSDNDANLSDDNDLIGLTLSVGTLSPGFSTQVLNYDVNVANDVEEIKVTPVTSDEKALISINNVRIKTGEDSRIIFLRSGENKIDIEVTAENHERKMYSITIHKEFSSDANLKEISIKEGTLKPAFDSAVTNYTVEVGYDVESITFTAEKSYYHAVKKTVKDQREYYFSTIPLDLGENTINVEVTAEDGTCKLYTVVVTRRKSNNNLLSWLYISKGELSPVFKDDVHEYTATVNNNVENIEVKARPSFIDATVKIDDTQLTNDSLVSNVDLVHGENTVEIEVTAQDGTKRVYTIVVTREISSNARLFSIGLTVGSLNPYFEKDITEYTLDVSNSTEIIQVRPYLDEVSSTVTVNSFPVMNYQYSQVIGLDVGENNIEIKVTAEDGTIMEYIITVNRADTYNTFLSDLTISEGIIESNFGYEYYASVKSVVNSISVTPTVMDSKSSIFVNDQRVDSGKPSQLIDLEEGSNTILIKVTSIGCPASEYTLKVYKRVAEKIYLKNLYVTSCTLSPEFSSTVYDYSVSVDNSVVSVRASALLMSSSVSTAINMRMNGGVYDIIEDNSYSDYYSLNVGENLLEVALAKQDTPTVYYRVVITRAPSDDTSLSNVNLSSGYLSPTFSSNKYTYTSTVDHDVDEITVTPYRWESTGSIEIGFNDQELVPIEPKSASDALALNVGENTIVLLVTAEDGSQQTYTVTVTRKKSYNNRLALILVSPDTVNLGFSSNKTMYYKSVANDISNIILTPTAEDPAATIQLKVENGAYVDIESGAESDDIPLAVGITDIEFLVTAENGLTKSYTIEFNRKISENVNLASLMFSHGTLSPEFSADRTSYTASVAHEITEVTVTPSLEDLQASITVGVNHSHYAEVISGNESHSLPLEIGENTIYITVKTSDFIKKSYTITLTRAASGNNNLSSLILSSGDLTPTFDTAVTSYSAAAVAYNDYVVDVTPVVEEDTASVRIRINDEGFMTMQSVSTSVQLALNQGDNTIDVEVVAADESTKTYSIFIVRESYVKPVASSLVGTWRDESNGLTGGAFYKFRSDNSGCKVTYSMFGGNATTKPFTWSTYNDVFDYIHFDYGDETSDEMYSIFDDSLSIGYFEQYKNQCNDQVLYDDFVHEVESNSTKESAMYIPTDGTFITGDLSSDESDFYIFNVDGDNEYYINVEWVSGDTCNLTLNRYAKEWYDLGGYYYYEHLGFIDDNGIKADEYDRLDVSGTSSGYFILEVSDTNNGNASYMISVKRR